MSRSFPTTVVLCSESQLTEPDRSAYGPADRSRTISIQGSFLKKESADQNTIFNMAGIATNVALQFHNYFCILVLFPAID
jgi:hypothetical protein